MSRIFPSLEPARPVAAASSRAAAGRLRLGLTLVTPIESTSGMVTFAKKDIGQSEIARKLQAGKINVRLAANWLRLSPSVYNGMADIDRFLEVIS